MSKRQRVRASEQGAVCVYMVAGSSPLDHKNSSSCLLLGGDRCWAAGGKSTPATHCVKGTLPQLASLARGLPRFSTLLGCVINSSLKDIVRSTNPV